MSGQPASMPENHDASDARANGEPLHGEKQERYCLASELAVMKRLVMKMRIKDSPAPFLPLPLTPHAMNRDERALSAPGLPRRLWHLVLAYNALTSDWRRRTRK